MTEYKAVTPYMGNDTVTPDEFARRCVATARKTQNGLSIHDAICKTSEREGLDFHRGYYEYGQAKNALIKLIREPKDATVFDKNGTPLNAKPVGEFNNLLGKKLFPDMDRGRVPQWAGTAKPVKSDYEAVDGRGLPIVRDFIQQQKAMLGLGYEDEFTAEWVERKICSAPVIRHDLVLAIKSMQDRITMLKNGVSLQNQVNELAATVSRLTRDREFAQAA